VKGTKNDVLCALCSQFEFLVPHFVFHLIHHALPSTIALLSIGGERGRVYIPTEATPVVVGITETKLDNTVIVMTLMLHTRPQY
jgi:accessory gene regulator protein AgrB